MRTSKRVSGQIPPAYSHLSQLGRDPPIKPLWSKEGGREREREREGVGGGRGEGNPKQMASIGAEQNRNTEGCRKSTALFSIKMYNLGSWREV